MKPKSIIFIRKKKKLFKFLVILLIIGSVIYLTFPDTSWLKEQNPRKTHFMTLAAEHWNGKILHHYIPYEKIDQDLKNAIYLSEDASFWIHHGIDWHEVRVVIADFFRTKKAKRGASTITQQLAKNLFLSPDRTIIRKVREYIYTISLEYYLTKRRIFELYLNYVQFGKTVFGVDAAARYYFHHGADSVTVLEAAKLAAILPAPTKWSPLNITNRLQKRIKIILERMYKFHKISQEEYRNAIEKLEGNKKKGEQDEHQDIN
jgi:monofunctional biosynthetic peptidoglycan transglycosylase